MLCSFHNNSLNIAHIYSSTSVTTVDFPQKWNFINDMNLYEINCMQVLNVKCIIWKKINNGQSNKNK